MTVDILIKQVRSLIIEFDDELSKQEIYNHFYNEAGDLNLSEEEFYSQVLKPASKNIDWEQVAAEKGQKEEDEKQKSAKQKSPDKKKEISTGKSNLKTASTKDDNTNTTTAEGPILTKTAQIPKIYDANTSGNKKLVSVIIIAAAIASALLYFKWSQKEGEKKYAGRERISDSNIPVTESNPSSANRKGKMNATYPDSTEIARKIKKYFEYDNNSDFEAKVNFFSFPSQVNYYNKTYSIREHLSNRMKSDFDNGPSKHFIKIDSSKKFKFNQRRDTVYVELWAVYDDYKNEDSIKKIHLNFTLDRNYRFVELYQIKQITQPRLAQ